MTTPVTAAVLIDPLAAAPQAERRLQLALWASGEQVWEFDAASDRMVVHPVDGDAVGPTLDRLLPGAAEGLAVLQFMALVYPDDAPALQLAWRLHLRGTHADIDLTFRVADVDAAAEGRLRWLRLRGQALRRNADGAADRVLGTLADVTTQHEAEDALRLMAQAFGSTRDAMALVDGQWTVLEVNAALSHLTGKGSGVRPGANLRQWLAVDEAALLRAQADGSWREELDLVTPGGAVPVELAITAVSASDGRRPCFLVALHDLRERRQNDLRMQRMVLVDKLTELPNRLAAQLHIDKALSHPEPELGLLFINLDGFKEVNDCYGHDSGDLLLGAVAHRLRAALPPDALLARWGGDEYLVVLAQGSGDTEVRSAAQGALAALAGRFSLGGHELSVSATLGAVLAPQDGLEFSELLRKADSAAFAGKQAGRNCLVFFDRSLDNDVQRRMRMTSQLRIDTERNGFGFVAQPKVDAQGRPLGAELLMRWNTEDFGPVSPIEFIPLAEKVGLIQLMGRHAAHAAAQLAAASAALGYVLPVAVNLSPKQLLHPGLDSLLLQACRRHGIAPSLLQLELTESALVHNMDVVKPMLYRLRGHGFSLALDDFGTGYSSLSYLRHLPFDTIKIDRSFVMDIDRDPAAVHLLDSIVRLCQVLGMKTVAEGVETPHQLAALVAMGVNEFQGYYFSRPIPVDDWLQLLRDASGQLPTLPLALPEPVGQGLRAAAARA